MALKIVMFSDYICPFCYVGFETIRKLKPEFDFQLEWRGFQIHPDWPAARDSRRQGCAGWVTNNRGMRSGSGSARWPRRWDFR